MAAATSQDTKSTESIPLQSESTKPTAPIQKSSEQKMDPNPSTEINQITESEESESNGITDNNIPNDVNELTEHENDEKIQITEAAEYDVNQESITVVVISDTHGHHDKIPLPAADILIHCGDFTDFSNLKHLVSFNQWLGTLAIPKERRLMVSGNHEIKQNFELKSGRAFKWKQALSNGTLLQNKTVSLYGITIHGVCWKGDDGSSGKWKGIPKNADIVITHNPPAGILDEGWGDLKLREKLEKIHPLLHLYGHAHSGYGIFVDQKRNIHYINASSVNFQRKPVNAPIVLRITKGKKDKLAVEVMNEDKELLFKKDPKQKRSMKSMN